MGLAQGGEHLVGTRGFQQVAAGTGADRLADLGLVLKHRQDDDPAVGRVAMHLGDGFEAAAAGQAEIEQQHVRPLTVRHGAQGGEQGLRIGEGAGGRKAGIGRAQAQERATKSVVILDDPNTDGGFGFHERRGRQRGRRGTCRQRRVPRPGALSISKRAFNTAARSRRLPRP